jgi:3-oxoacyl-[acyl-carrier-protein] synthase III
MTIRVGILGIGSYLPPEIRRNDWWSKDLVAQWTRQRPAPAPRPDVTRLSDAARRIVAALAVQADDPFQGSIERRILEDDMTVVDMEVHASNDAIERAGVDRAEIDLLLTHTVAPEVQLSNPAALLHHRLGLGRECLAMQTEAATYSFLDQLAIADAMISAGRARCALLVQSCAASRLVEPDDPVAPYFGDAATAVVVAGTSRRGILSAVHFTDGRYPNTLVASVPKGTWYAAGRPVIHLADPAGMREVMLQTVDLCKSSVEAALARCEQPASAVRFFCMHQGTPWLRELAQEFSGLTAAASVETFTKTGYVFSAILPLGLRAAQEQHLLEAGDLAVLFSGGTGMTYGATVLEWSAR